MIYGGLEIIEDAIHTYALFNMRFGLRNYHADRTKEKSRLKAMTLII
jgi:hypothetical protein